MGPSTEETYVAVPFTVGIIIVTVETARTANPARAPINQADRASCLLAGVGLTKNSLLFDVIMSCCLSVWP
jgi:hypothetical protein